MRNFTNTVSLPKRKKLASLSIVHSEGSNI